MNRKLRAKQILATGVSVIALCAAFPIDSAGGAPPNNANLITLPSFEVPVAPPAPSPAVLFPPGSHIGPWTVSYSTAAVSGEFPPIVNGIKGVNKQFLSLKDPIGGTRSATVCQRVNLDPALRYRLRFYGAAVTLDATILVIWQRRIVARFTETGSVGNTAWLHHTVRLGPAPGAQFGELCFSSQGDGYAILDAVNLQPIA